MCEHHNNKNNNYFGSAIEHGAAHTKDHKKWNRRQFLTLGGLCTVGSLLLRSTPVSALMPNAFTNELNNSGSDNILVLIRLFGGNDGLNTIIPHTSDVYNEAYLQFRPNLGLQHNTHYNDQDLMYGWNHTIGDHSLGKFAMPQEMRSLIDLWHTQKMSVIHSVGYPSANFSHFVSEDFWSTGSNATNDPLYNSGWMGRYLEQEYADENSNIPPAILIGNRSDLSFINQQKRNMAFMFADSTDFENFASAGVSYPNDNFQSNCANIVERRFLRELYNNGQIYSQSVLDAYNNGNACGYNTNSELSNKLNIISRLIKGNLGTRIYMVTLDGFDTHAYQMGAHQSLLGDLANSVTDFINDLSCAGYGQKVLAMCYSEFGRTIKENGSNGTDHGSLNPVLFFGEPTAGNFHGTPIKLDDPALEYGQNVSFEGGHQAAIDFRDVYSTVLQDWLCVNPSVVFPGMTSFNHLPYLIENPCGIDPNCAFEVHLGNQTLTGNQTHQSSDLTTSSGVVASGANVTLKSETTVEMKPGFEVKEGGVLDVKIENCNSQNEN